MHHVRRSVPACLTLTALLWAGAPLAAQAGGEAGQPQMSAEEKAMMEAWMKAMTPGPQHQHLAAHTGTWSGTVKLWQAPGAPPEISQASSQRTLGLGGRVLIDHWTGSMMGMPFEGMGMTGYDNAAKRWWSTWSDNFGTGVMISYGNCAEDPTQGCTYSATFFDPTTGQEGKSRSVVSWPTPDQEKMEMFMVGPDGKEFKSMEILVRRQK